MRVLFDSIELQFNFRASQVLDEASFYESSCQFYYSTRLDSFCAVIEINLERKKF